MSVAEFNSHIKDLFMTFKELPSQKFKSRLHIGELQSKIFKGINMEPEYAIVFVGPILWNCRDEIVNRNYDFFTNYRYEMSAQKFAVEHRINYDDLINTIYFMVDAFKQTSPDMKEKIYTVVTNLLSTYAAYLKTSK